MKKPEIDWFDPVFPAVCLTLMTVTAYGGLRENDLSILMNSLAWICIAWADQYLKGEKEKRLPRESYLVDPLPPIKS